MNCLRCGHRLNEEGRQWHKACPDTCSDPWCSHPSHEEAGKPAILREKIQPSAIPAEPVEKWLCEAEGNGKKVKVAAPPKKEIALIEKCETIKPEWGEAVVFGTPFGRIIFFIKSPNEVLLLEDADGRFRIHGSLKRIILTMIARIFKEEGHGQD